MHKRNLRDLINTTALRLVLLSEPPDPAPAPAGDPGGGAPAGEGGAAADPPAAEAAPEPAAAAAGDGDGDDDPKPKRTPWQVKRIDTLTAEKNREREARERAEAEAADAKRQVAAYEALYGKDGKPAGDPAPAAPAAPAGDGQRTFTQEDVQKEAARIAAVTALNGKLESLFDEGDGKFPDTWKAQAQAAGTAFGEELKARMDFFEALTELPNPAEVYHALTGDLDHMAEVLAMPPLKLGIELAKLSTKAATKPRGPGVSKAADPIDPLKGGAPEPVKDMAKVPMNEYAADFEARQKRRAERYA